MKLTIQKISIFIAMLFSIYCIYCTYIVYEYLPGYTYYNDCGIIVSKPNDEVNIKHGVKTVFYLNVEFEKTGFKTQEVDVSTYFKYNKWDRICFNLFKKDKELKPFYLVCAILGVIAFIVWIAIGLSNLESYLNRRNNG